MGDEFTIDNIFGSYNGIYIDPDVKVAFKEYTGNAFERMNRITRYGKLGSIFAARSKNKKDGVFNIPLKDELIKMSQNAKYIDVIKDFFKVNEPFVPTSRIILYRRIKEKAVHELIQNGTLIDKGFTSTTVSIIVAANMVTVDKGYTVRLHMLPSIPYKLYPAKYFSSVKFEEEVVFDANMTYYLCNTTHKMKIAEKRDKCEDVLDCIFIPKEYSYLLEKNNNEWYDHWSRIINSENKYVFTDIISENCYYNHDEYIFHFIQEIEYFMQQTIWKNIQYTKERLFKSGSFSALTTRLVNKYNTTYAEQILIYPYLKSIRENIMQRVNEFEEKIPQNYFSYTKDWRRFILQNIRIKYRNSVSANAILQIKIDLKSLLREVDESNYLGAGGLKKEIRKSIRNVNALIAAQAGRA